MSGTVSLSLFLLGALVCVVAEALIVRATIRVATSPPAPGSPLPAPPTAFEIVWAILPAIALAVVLAVTWNAVRSPARQSLVPSPPPPGLTAR